MMSKKDYQAIAGAIHKAGEDVAHSMVLEDWKIPHGPEVPALIKAGARAAIKTVAAHVAGIMAQDNPRFNRALFLEACETGKCRGMRQAS